LNFYDFLDFLNYLEKKAPDKEYWYWYTRVGWPIPKRSQDSWWERFKRRHGWHTLTQEEEKFAWDAERNRIKYNELKFLQPVTKI
jgi:hypothetical protein